MKHNLIVLLLLLAGTSAFSQVFTNKEVGKKNEELVDSLKVADYPYALPIWGQKVTNLGYDLPYSAGISAQYFWQESDIVIENLMVGFNNGQMYDIDELVRFDKAVATASAYSVRPDVWVFPFLDVYAILGQTQASTAVGFGIWIPDSTNTDREILSYDTKVDFTATTFGFGMTPTIGIGGGFLALDMNMAWTDIPQLDRPAFSFVFGPRLGKNFKLKNEQALAIWTGGFRVHLNSETNGSIALSDVLPADAPINGKIDEGYAKVDESQQQVDAWWNGLNEMEMNNPINKAKYESANNALDKAGQILVSVDNAVNTISSSTVQYSMDKRPKDMWNFIVGGQYQYNKHWMIRFEGGFLGSRVQIMTGVQYRFGL